MHHGSGCTGTCVYRGCGLGWWPVREPPRSGVVRPSGPRECPEELPPRFGVCALPDLPARSSKVAPWLDGGLSSTSAVHLMWLLTH